MLLLIKLYDMPLNKEILRNVPIFSYVTRENTEAVPKENEVSDFNIPPDATEDEDKPMADIGQDTIGFFVILLQILNKLRLIGVEYIFIMENWMDY